MRTLKKGGAPNSRSRSRNRRSRSASQGRSINSSGMDILLEQVNLYQIIDIN